MADGIYAALSGACAQARALDVVANNLANATTTGFKQERLSFREALAGAVAQGDVTHRQVRTEGGGPDLRPGVVRHTGNPLDVALLGAGFFVVQTQDGERLTRSGALSLSSQGVLVSGEGFPVLGQNGPIPLAETSGVHLDNAGRVWVGDRVVDRLRIALPAPPESLSRIGESLWSARRLDEVAATEGLCEPAALEASNVNPVHSMTELVFISRAYEMLHRTIETYDTLSEKTAAELGR